MNEDEQRDTPVAVTGDQTITQPEPAWGQAISAERQAELQVYLDRWEAETDHGQRQGPFDREGREGTGDTVPRLTGADVFWLAEQVRDVEGRLSQLQ
jgi:hypothetical protein